MTYELAKQLKDARFPIRKKCLCESEPCVHLNYPTLEELIEACGDGFFGLNRLETDKWSCHFMEDENHTGEPVYSTPEEAVAKLWLGLQEPK